MPFNRDFISRSWKADHIYEVSREKVREYAVAIDEMHPAYIDEKAAAALGHPAPYAPSTFATTLCRRTRPCRCPEVDRAPWPFPLR
ncbi:FAS1-like dehydratase domain-containing protein [Streptomyces humicola]|uniref:FAS1-like dehydratase domain-containing protein n=1 Tax=Streptomyces humicola TaxID=2953240 RepID=UPI0035580B2F